MRQPAGVGLPLRLGVCVPIAIKVAEDARLFDEAVGVLFQVYKEKALELLENESASEGQHVTPAKESVSQMTQDSVRIIALELKTRELASRIRALEPADDPVIEEYRNLKAKVEQAVVEGKSMLEIATATGEDERYVGAIAGDFLRKIRRRARNRSR